jgi:hypothetical protein
VQSTLRAVPENWTYPLFRVRLAIKDFLWSDETGLPMDHYDEDEVVSRAEEVYRHVYRAYPEIPSPFYESSTLA